MSDSKWWEVAVGFLVIFIYHAQVFLRYWWNPLSVFLGLNLKARRRWVLRMLEKESRAILAIQTIRNTNTTATLLASTTITVSTLVLQRATTEQNSSQKTKLYLVTAAMFGAFLFLLLTLRALNNANYFTLVSEDPLGPEFLRAEMLVDKHKKTDELNMTSVENVELGANSELPSSSGAAEAEISKAALKKYHIKKVAGFQRVMEMVEWYFFFAFRLLMLSIPLALWLSSSLMFMLSSIVLVTILIINDGVGSVKNIDL